MDRRGGHGSQPHSAAKFDAYRAEFAGTSPLRSTKKFPNPYAVYTVDNNAGNQPSIGEMRRQRKVQIVKSSKIKELIDVLEEQAKGKRESGQYCPGPLAEEYAAKIMPRARHGHATFTMPIKPPTHMEYYEEDVLANALKEMIQIDKDVELRKNQLSLKSDFNMHDFYNVFDVENKGHFDFRHFQEVYDLFKIYPEQQLLRLAFRKIDKDLDSRITLQEFLQGLSPTESNYREVVLRRESIYNANSNFSRSETFTPDTQRCVIGFLKCLVDAESHLEKVRRGIDLRRNFIIKDAFRALDQANKGHIVLEDVRALLTSRFIFCPDNEIQYLFDRFDKIKCGQISLNEFTREMRPKLLP